MNKRIAAATAVLLFALSSAASGVDDARELVKLPPMMREHMLGNMRDHLLTLDQILGAVAEAKFDDAAKLAEARLGMVLLQHLAHARQERMLDVVGNRLRRLLLRRCGALFPFAPVPLADAVAHAEQVPQHAYQLALIEGLHQVGVGTLGDALQA